MLFRSVTKGNTGIRNLSDGSENHLRTASSAQTPDIASWPAGTDTVENGDRLEGPPPSTLSIVSMSIHSIVPAFCPVTISSQEFRLQTQTPDCIEAAMSVNLAKIKNTSWPRVHMYCRIDAVRLAWLLKR